MLLLGTIAQWIGAAFNFDWLVTNGSGSGWCLGAIVGLCASISKIVQQIRQPKRQFKSKPNEELIDGHGGASRDMDSDELLKLTNPLRQAVNKMQRSRAQTDLAVRKT